MEVDEESLSLLQARLRPLGTVPIALVSVMGAFRTGKSFLLDLFLRYLRHEKSNSMTHDSPPQQETGFTLPAWVTAAGNQLEGAGESTDGFRFKGGMDVCTEGIWVWSEPFIRMHNGQKIVVLLMDTQGAWDSSMTKEQSASIFGLTTVLSSKQIYNVKQQIQEDKVENLGYFVSFAQMALRAAHVDMNIDDQETCPFQNLTFLVRDWGHYEEGWTLEQCRKQMLEHFNNHLNPEVVTEHATVEALQKMFQNIDCFCLPHPGLKIQKTTWNGNVHDIDMNFLRFVDAFVTDVFTTNITPKKILGSELSTFTFSLLLRNFVKAFHEAAPSALTFTQAVTNSTVLLAKEKCMKIYSTTMEEAIQNSSGGLRPDAFVAKCSEVESLVKKEYELLAIFGSEEIRNEAWVWIEEHMATLRGRYELDNNRRLEMVLEPLAPISIIGVSIFVLDRISDITCDWWSTSCANASKAFFLVDLIIGFFVGAKVLFLYKERGQLGTFRAVTQLWNSMARVVAIRVQQIKQAMGRTAPKRD